MGDIDVAGSGEVAIDVESADESLHELEGAAECLVEAASPRLAQVLLHDLGIGPYPGVHLSHVAPRPAMADTLGLQHDNVGTALGEVDGAGEAGVAGPDDHHVGSAFVVERSSRRRRIGGRGPQRAPEVVEWIHAGQQAMWSRCS